MDKIKKLGIEIKELKEEIKNKEIIIDSLVELCRKCPECQKKINKIWDDMKIINNENTEWD